MVDRGVLAAKLAELALRTARARSHCPATAEALAADLDTLDIVSFNLMLAVQVCLDVASHLIADQRWRPAGTLAGAFERLREHGVIGAATATSLGRAAGLRHVVAHGYGGIDVRIVHAAATAGATDLEAFAREVAAWLSSATPT